MKDLINKLLIGGMLILGLIFFIFGNHYKFFLALTYILAFWFLAWVIKKMKMNGYYKTLICIFLWLSFLGELYFYRNFKYYDKILHLLIPFFMAMMAYSFLKRYNLPYLKIITFSGVFGLLALFEVFEYTNDFIFGLDMIGVQSRTGGVLLDSFTDTMFDLISGGIGSLLYLIFKK